MRRFVAFGLALGLPVAGCNLITGIGDYSASSAHAKHDATASVDSGATTDSATVDVGIILQVDAGLDATRDGSQCGDAQIVCDGGCVPSNNTNCARCGNVCADPNGCGAAGCVTTIVEDEVGVDGVATDGVYVYWTNRLGGTISRYPVQGGTTEILVRNQSGPAFITIAKAELYWANAGGLSAGTAGDSIVRSGIDGSNVMTIASSSNSEVIAVGGTNVYWTTSDVVRVQPQSGTLGTVAIGRDIFGITADEQNVYWVGLNTAGAPTISSAAINGSTSAVRQYAADLGVPRAIVLNDGGLYWSVGSFILRSSFDGGEPTEVASDQTVRYGLAVAGGEVFWTNSVDAGGSVYEVSVRGGKYVTVAAPVQAPAYIAADSTGMHVVWADSRGGMVQMLTR